jgi:hypothetical protein
MKVAQLYLSSAATAFSATANRRDFSAFGAGKDFNTLRGQTFCF